MAKIDHAAVRTTAYEDAQKFFEDVFEMHMWREIGEKPARKCWYKEGIQLCEVETVKPDGQNGYDHISIAVDSVEETMEKIKAYPTTTINDHWFSLPNGTKIELKLLENWKLNHIRSEVSVRPYRTFCCIGYSTIINAARTLLTKACNLAFIR